MKQKVLPNNRYIVSALIKGTLKNTLLLLVLPSSDPIAYPHRLAPGTASLGQTATGCLFLLKVRKYSARWRLKVLMRKLGKLLFSLQFTWKCSLYINDKVTRSCATNIVLLHNWFRRMYWPLLTLKLAISFSLLLCWLRFTHFRDTQEAEILFPLITRRNI